MSEQILYVRADSFGRIIQWGTMDDGIVTSLASDGFLPGDGRPDTHYVANGQILEKTTSPVTLNGLTLENVPVPSWLTIEGTTYQTNEPTVELSFNLPGAYPINVESVPFLTVTLEVTV